MLTMLEGRHCGGMLLFHQFPYCYYNVALTIVEIKGENVTRMEPEQKGENLVLMQVPLPLQGQRHLLLHFPHQPVVLLQCVGGAQLLDQLQPLFFPFKHLYQTRSERDLQISIPCVRHEGSPSSDLGREGSAPPFGTTEPVCSSERGQPSHCTCGCSGRGGSLASS